MHIVAHGVEGGGTSIVLGLASTQRHAYGADVEVWSDENSYALAEAARQGLKARGFRFMASRFSLSTCRAVERHLRTVDPSIVHLHGARAATTALLTRFARSHAAAFVYTVHGYHFLHKPLLARRLALAAERWISSRVDTTVFISRFDERLAARSRILTEERHSVLIPNGVDSASLPTPSHHKTFDLCFVGRLEMPKNPLFLAHLLAAFEHSRRPTLAVVGGGRLERQLREECEKLGVAKCVTFYGAVPRERALQILTCSRVLLLPSLWEGLPTAALEAQFLGVPVVGAATGGTPEAVADGETGYLFNTFEPVPYRRAIERLLEEGALYQRMSERARRRAVENFSHAASVAAYVRLYRTVLDDGRLGRAERPVGAAVVRP